MQRFQLFFLLMLITGVLLNSCENSPSQPVEPKLPTVDLASSRKEVVKQVSEQIIVPGYERTLQKSEELVIAINEFTHAPNEANLLTAQISLKETWLEWQKAAMFLFGPSETVTLRSSMATYPTDVNKIEANIASGDYVLGTLDNRSAVGFPALDYLLNGLGDTPAAIVDSYNNGEGSTNRKDYANALAQEINR